MTYTMKGQKPKGVEKIRRTVMTKDIRNPKNNQQLEGQHIRTCIYKLNPNRINICKI